MKWFGRGRRRAADVAPEPISDAAKALVEEGLMIITRTLWMRVKNELITSLLRDARSFDRNALLLLVHDEIARLVHEKETAQQYLRAMATRARTRPGIPDHSNDYRKADVRPLELRRQVEQGLADALRDMLDDDSAIDGIIDEARQSALNEIVPARLNLTVRYGPSLSPERKEAAMQAVADELAYLEQQHLRTAKKSRGRKT